MFSVLLFGVFVGFACGSPCSVVDKGAKGDNKTEDTMAIQNALNECNPVTFPAPGKYLTRPLLLNMSGQTVIVESGATVVAWGDINTYNTTSEVYPVFRGDSLSDVTIMGSGDGSSENDWGVVDGQGWRWWPYMKTRPRPHLVSMTHQTNFTLRNILLRDSPGWNTEIRGNKLEVANIRIEAGMDSCEGYDHAPNTDGINIGGTDIYVHDNFVHNGDDCVPLNPGEDGGDTQNVLVENMHCECGTNSAVGIIGGNNSVRDVVFRNFTVRGTNQGLGMKIAEAYYSAHGRWENVTYQDFLIDGVRNAAMYIDVYEEDAPLSGCKPSGPPRENWLTAINVTYRNIRAINIESPAYAGCFLCTPGRPCEGLNFDNVTIEAKDGFVCHNAYGSAKDTTPPACVTN